MKKLFYILVSFFALAYRGYTQWTYPNPAYKSTENIKTAIKNNNYIHLYSIINTDSWFNSTSEERAYYDLLLKLYYTGDTPETDINLFLENYPTNFNKDKLILTLGTIAIEKKDYNRAIYYLNEIDKNGLDNDDQSKLYLCLAIATYNTYNKNIISEDIQYIPKDDNIIYLLKKSISLDGLYSNKALFYLAIYSWKYGNKDYAYDVLKTTQWDETLKKEAKYWEIVFSFDRKDNNTALKDALQYISNYPEDNNIDLKRSIGVLYYNKQNHHKAEYYLAQAYQGTGNILDIYALYAYAQTLYILNKYTEAQNILKQLSQTILKHDNINKDIYEQSQILLASTYIKQNMPTEALSIYSNIISNTSIVEGNNVAEVAIYNSVLLQNKMGTSSFGQAVKLAKLYVNTFINSKNRKEISSILTKSFADSKDYINSLKELEQLKKPTKDLLKVKQYILLMIANNIDENLNIEKKQKYLLQAINLSNITSYYKDALFTLISLELKKGNYKQAEIYSTELIKETQIGGYKEGVAYYFQGYALFNQKLYSQALSSFKKYINEQPQNMSLLEDAYIRMGDCMYQGRTNFSQAIEYYWKANQIKKEGCDNALAKIVDIYAIQGQFDKEIEIIDTILTRSNDYSLRALLLYKKGKALILSKKSTDKAVSVFKSILDNYPQSEYAKLSLLDMALALYNNGENDLAIQYYKQLILEYPNSQEAYQAMGDLRSIYIQEDRLQEFISYRKSVGGNFEISSKEEENLLFTQAEEQYIKKGHKAEQYLTSYLDKYPNTPQSYKARYYLADVYFQSNQYDKAKAIYLTLSSSKLEQEIKNISIEKLAEIAYNKTNYNDASKYYIELYNNNSVSIDTKKRILLPLIESLFKIEKYNKVLELTSKNVIGITNDNKNNIYLIKAKCILKKNNKAEALKLLDSISQDIDTPVGAESYVTAAQIRYELNNLDKAQKDILSFIKKSTTQDYWLARAFILLSDIYTKMGDNYAATQYLHSLKENYTDANEEIQQMIEKRLSKLQKNK